MRVEGPEEGGCKLEAGFLQLREINKGIKEGLQLPLSGASSFKVADTVWNGLGATTSMFCFLLLL